ncbi:hypothetical protein ACL1IP_08245 [Corynebacterium striatum]
MPLFAEAQVGVFWVRAGGDERATPGGSRVGFKALVFFLEAFRCSGLALLGLEYVGGDDTAIRVD